jgi:hypothetical protein
LTVGVTRKPKRQQAQEQWQVEFSFHMDGGVWVVKW